MEIYEQVLRLMRATKTLENSEGIEMPEAVRDKKHEILFLCCMLDCVVGGKPSIGYEISTESFSIIPSCLCPTCEPFTEAYSPHYYKSLNYAAERYFIERAAYLLDLEEAKECGTKH